MKNDSIIISNAKVHNLKSINVTIPKNTLSVITGPSGSGKSSLAFDTIYVEGQRRYIESLSSYARQFLGQYQPPDVESITGLSPAIAIDQKTVSKNPRSTVGTITEIYDYLRVLYSRVGEVRSFRTNKIIKKYTPAQILKEIYKEKENSKLYIIAPIENLKDNEFKSEISRLLSLGLSRIKIGSEFKTLQDLQAIKKNFPKEIHAVIDRMILKPENKARVVDSLELALKLSNGKVSIFFEDETLKKSKLLVFSENFIDPDNNEKYPDLEPRLFSFNSPIGACTQCNGLGEIKIFNKNLMIANQKLPLFEAILPLHKRNTFLHKMVECIAEQEEVDTRVPFNKLPKKFIQILFEGTSKEYVYSFTSENSKFQFKKDFPGIPRWLEKKFLETQSDKVRKEMEQYMDIGECPGCSGQRLNKYALSTFIDNKNIIQISQFAIEDAFTFFAELKLEGERAFIAQKLIKEISSRLRFLLDVGLGYLNLGRSAGSLSGGEGQRIRLATQIGSSLSGVLYVLDEPSIGLHQRDNSKLIKTLKALRDIGNTVIVVEHDEETIKEADYIIDMGPKAGIYGGEVVAYGDYQKILNDKNSPTGKFLSGKSQIEIPKNKRKVHKTIKLNNASMNNLKNISVEIPLEILCCITGVSGSGKSTLTHKILVPAIKNYLQSGITESSEHSFQSIEGIDQIQSIIELDQSPIGRTPHSNPATYAGVFDIIRDVFSQLPDSKIRGYKAGRFSFNVKGGRCEDCEGNGVKKIEMHFLPDVFVTCSDCNGTRFNSETLSIRYKDKNIADILQMSIEEGLEFFKNHPKIARTLQTLHDVGLGYIKLGQSATTLSGGEAQRLKLSKELSRKPKGKCLYILDEPTTGLHFEDIKILLVAIHKLIEQGNGVIVIEHNLDVIKTADHVIDMGPEGGAKGGQIIFAGAPEKIIKEKDSYTGKYLKKFFS